MCQTLSKKHMLKSLKILFLSKRFTLDCLYNVYLILELEISYQLSLIDMVYSQSITAFRE